MTTETTTGMPPDYCHDGSILRQTERDWAGFAHEERQRARRSDARHIEARRRREIHDASCPRCVGGPRYG